MNNKDDFDLIKMSPKRRENDGYEDISSSYEDIYSKSRHSGGNAPRKSTKGKKKKRKKHIFLKIFAAVLCAAVIFGACFYAYGYRTIEKIPRTPLDSADLGISTDNYASVKNIALLGIDTHEDNLTGRSDAVVVLTVDKKHKKLKLTSIARDSYVSIDGHGNDKLTHAYAYGKSQLAVKTLNQNFGLEITDYVTVNFFKFARIIDYVGGVTVDVSEAEMNEMNVNIIPWLVEMGIDCEPVVSPGIQMLSGGQAVCYARIRHTDSDIERGNRQKEVLMSMFSQVKHMNPLKLPKLAEMIGEQCETSMPTKDIISLGMWAVLSSPEFEQLSIPNDNFDSAGKTIRGTWYYVYDLEAASRDIHDFIFEENYYSPEAVAERKAQEEEV